MLSISPQESVISDCLNMLYILSFYNKSTSNWLPHLRDAMKQLHDSYFSLVTGVVAGWNTTWMSFCSVLRGKITLELVFILHAGDIHQIIDQPPSKGLKSAREITMSCEFWPKLSNSLYILIPTVESSFILQSSRATLADFLYCYRRQVQVLSKYMEDSVMGKLEKLFSSLEVPIIFTMTLLQYHK